MRERNCIKAVVLIVSFLGGDSQSFADDLQRRAAIEARHKAQRQLILQQREARQKALKGSRILRTAPLDQTYVEGSQNSQTASKGANGSSTNAVNTSKAKTSSYNSSIFSWEERGGAPARPVAGASPPRPPLAHGNIPAPKLIPATAATAPRPSVGHAVYYEYLSPNSDVKIGRLVVKFKYCPEGLYTGRLYSWTGKSHPQPGTPYNKFQYVPMGLIDSCDDDNRIYTFEGYDHEQVFWTFSNGDATGITAAVEKLPPNVSWVRLPSAADYAAIEKSEKDKAIPNPLYPTDLEIAQAMAYSFYSASDPVEKKAKIIRYEGMSSQHGASTVWDADGESNFTAAYGKNAYLERQIFFVRDDPMPKCHSIKNGAVSCEFAFHFETEVEDIIADVGAGVAGSLSGKQQSQPRSNQWTNRFLHGQAWKSDFWWQPVTVTFVKVHNQWTSPTLEKQMLPITTSIAKTRKEFAVQRRRSMDAFAEGVHNANTCFSFQMANASEFAPPELNC